MLFTEKDIKQILGIIDTAVAKMVAETLGKDYLTCLLYTSDAADE